MLPVRVHHLAAGALVAGLVLGSRVPALVVAGVAAAVLAACARGGLAPSPRVAVGVAVLLAAGAAISEWRVAQLERSRLGPGIGHSVAGRAILLAHPETDRFGGWRALARWRGEPVLVRGARWVRPPGEGPGAVLMVHGELRAPDLAARAVRAHATLRVQTLRPTGARRGGVAGAIDSIRRRAEKVLTGGLPPPLGGLARGMVLGQDEAMPRTMREDFRRAGLAHLTAASGSNVLLLATIALAAGALTGLPITARRWMVVGLIALYVPLAGGGPSIQRAGIMGAAGMAALMAGRPVLRWYALGLAAAVTLVLDPRAAADPGWQMSFAAVVGILTLAPPIRTAVPGHRVVAEAVAITTAATLATAPIITLHFGRTSLVSLPVNVLAVPAVAPVMWLGMLAAAAGQLFPAAASWLAGPAALPLGYLSWLAGRAASLSWAEAAPGPLPVVAVCCLAAVVVCVARVRRAAGRLAPAAGAAVVALVATGTWPLGAGGPGTPAPGVLRVTFLDVGQGDATLVQAGGAAVLVDAGPPDGPVVGRLREAGVRRLDLAVATHGSADHLGGLPAVLRAFRVDALLDGRDGDRSPVAAALDPALGRTRRVVPDAGDEVRVGPLGLRILWPPRDAPPADDPNDRTIVAQARAYGHSILLTADSESPVLSRLELPAVDLLKVAHHGSADPGLPDVLSRLAPRLAVIPVGRGNGYGHPAPSTLAALRAVPSVLRTDRDGTVRVEVGAQGIRVWRAG